MQTVKWEYYPLVAQNTLTHAFIEELAQVRRSPSTVDNYSRDLEDFLQALVEVPFPAVLEADETLIARYLDSLWNRPARRGSGHKLSREHVTYITGSHLSLNTIPFRTKPDLAIHMLERLHQARVPLTWLEAHQYAYVGAVACDEPVVLATPGGVRRLEVQDVPALVLTDSCWHRLAMSEGTKGPRLFDWAGVPLLHRGADDGWHSLLIRRTIDATPQLAYYLVFAPPATPLLAKVTALGGRWRIEEDFASGKDLGLDHSEVRSFVGWYRHITLVMLALAFLVSLCAQARPLALPTADGETPPEARAASHDLVPLSVPEVRHLLAHLLFPPPSSFKLVVQWSAWRRWHQRLASLFHTRRRLKAG